MSRSESNESIFITKSDNRHPMDLEERKRKQEQKLKSLEKQVEELQSRAFHFTEQIDEIFGSPTIDRPKTIRPERIDKKLRPSTILQKRQRIDEDIPPNRNDWSKCPPGHTPDLSVYDIPSPEKIRRLHHQHFLFCVIITFVICIIFVRILFHLFW